MPALEMANDVGATRRSLQRRRSVVVLVAVGALVCFWLAANSLAAGNRGRSLERNGVAASGSVVAVDARPIGHGLPPNGSVIVRYPVDGDLRDASIWVGSTVSGYRVGQNVDVVFEPDDPSKALIAGAYADRNIPIGPSVCIGLILLGMALVSGRHLRAIEKILRWERWAVLPARLTEDECWAGPIRVRTLLVLESVDADVAVETIGLNRFDPGFEPEAWVAGLGSRRMVVARPGGSHVLLVMPVKMS